MTEATLAELKTLAASLEAELASLRKTEEALSIQSRDIRRLIDRTDMRLEAVKDVLAVHRL